MLNKRGASYGAEYPYHYEWRTGGWAVFHAGTDKDVRAWIKNEWEAQKLCMEENGIDGISQEVRDAIDTTE